MFAESADLYDLVYAAYKDYPAEATELANLIRSAHPHARTILDVACGTGEHARLLTEQHGFVVDGLDLDPAFVRIAQQKLPRASVSAGDMTSFAVPGRYDVVLCLFSSIGYVRTLQNVQRTLERFHAHLYDHSHPCRMVQRPASATTHVGQELWKATPVDQFEPLGPR